jgi:hypothetical protein
MRAAYYGGTALTDAGQNLGLLEFGGTDLTDLNTYFQQRSTNEQRANYLALDRRHQHWHSDLRSVR